MLSIAAFLGVALLGVLPGIVIAVALSILNVFRRVVVAVPGRARPGRRLPGFHDVASYPDAELLPGLRRSSGSTPRCSSPTPVPSAIRSGGSPAPSRRPALDPGRGRTDHRRRHDRRRHARGPRRGPERAGIYLVFAEMKDPVSAKVERYELTRTIDPEHFYPTIDAAVEAFRAMTGAEWQPAERGDDER